MLDSPNPPRHRPPQSQAPAHPNFPTDPQRRPTLLGTSHPQKQCKTTHLDIRPTLNIRLRQHAQDAQQNTPDPLDRGPALRGGFVSEGIVPWGVEDRDAYFARGVDWSLT